MYIVATKEAASNN